jgi:hypothetical protein
VNRQFCAPCLAALCTPVDMPALDVSSHLSSTTLCEVCVDFEAWWWPPGVFSSGEVPPRLCSKAKG